MHRLDLLAESIQQQKVWARDFPHFWPGVAAYQLYDEEREPLTRMRRLLRDGGKDVAELRAAFDQVAPRLRTYAPDLHGALEAHLKEPKSPEEVAAKLEAFLANVPEGYYPPVRLTRTLERVRFIVALLPKLFFKTDLPLCRQAVTDSNDILRHQC